MEEWAKKWLTHQLPALSITLFGGVGTAKLGDICVEGSAQWPDTKPTFSQGFCDRDAINLIFPKVFAIAMR